MKDKRTVAVMVRLTPEVHAALVAESEREERTVAQTIRLAVRRHLASPGGITE
jgi:predicted HicB family RNase H-like nuclease